MKRVNAGNMAGYTTAGSGKEWDAVAWITGKQLLKVRGFWHFELLGQTMAFRKITSVTTLTNHL
jgi:hypothetical protein